MKKENVYVASDGKKFDTEKECNNYEDVCNAIKILDNYCIKTKMSPVVQQKGGIFSLY